MPSSSALLSAIRNFSDRDQQLVKGALETATQAHKDQKRKDGTPYVEHPIAVALILAEWHADAETIAAGLLHDTVEDSALTREQIARHFGSTVAQLVEGVTKITETDIASRQGSDGEGLTLDRKVETLRKLFDVLRQDIRALVIKIADRLHNVRTIERLAPDRQVRFAKETLEIYYKLAYHLGLNDVRRAFSEICAPIAYPKEAAELIAIRDHQLEAGQPVLSTVERKLRALDRRKTIREMRLEGHSLVSLLKERQRPDFNEDQAIYVVIVTTDEDGCYTTLKNLHGLYRPRSALFRDFIASPSRSGYQSLHTTVIDEADDMLDVRIRTQAMDDEEHAGMLPYAFGKGKWKGKEFDWLQRSATFDEATKESSAAFWQALQSDILQENVTVVVDGKEMQLPKNATVLDALYARHGPVAHRALRVNRNGNAAFFGDAVSEDDAIDASLDVRERAQFDWISWVNTAYSRSLITDALKQRSREEKLAAGRGLLQRELDHYRRGFLGDLGSAQQEQIARKFERTNFEEVLVMIGEGVIPPREAVFALLPEKRRWRPWGRSDGQRRFQITVSGAHLRRDEILSRLAAVAQYTGVEIEGTQIRFHEKSKTFSAVVSGRAERQVQFGDFLSALDRAEWTSSVQTMLSQGQRLILGTILAGAASIVFLDILLLPQYERLFSGLPPISWIILGILPLLPILGVNYYLLKLLRNYSVRLRQDRWFVGLGFTLNICGLLLVIAQSMYYGVRLNLLFLLGILTISLLYVAYQFFRSEAMYLVPDAALRPGPLREAEWVGLRRKKTIGYAIRVAAVTIWGLVPIYIRYTEANALSPFLRTFLLSAGVLATCGVAYVLASAARGRKPGLHLSYDRYFICLVAGQIGFMYFINASLMYTSGTNFLLFANFGPVIGLLIASVFWRKDIPYLRDPRHMLWIFILAVTGSFGSTLLFINTLHHDSAPSLIGDILAFIAVFFDVLMTIGQIEYIKRHIRTDGLLLNVHIFSFVLVLSTPVVGVLYAAGHPVLAGLNGRTLLLGMGTGLIIGIGQLLNYEAFKRIDGYLAFMMFNLSVLLTFALETLVLRSLEPTALLILSGVLIVGSSIVAEMINSRCQRKGL